MDIYWWYYWLWWCAGVVAWYAVAAMVVRRWLVPWACWLVHRAMCWYHLKTIESRVVPTCRCCGGIDFDGVVGRWAVVTGCTDGIGKEYAFQLADRGMNVALVSRNENKLQTVAREIYDRHAGRIHTRIVVADFTSSGGCLTEAYDSVRRGLVSLDLAVLINNAGVSYSLPDRLIDLPPCCPTAGSDGDPCRDMIECNALAAVAMCRIVMPLMISDGYRNGDSCTGDGNNGNAAITRSPQALTSLPIVPINRGGVVVNISSVAARFPCPLISVYGATKVFLEKFSEELANEHGEDKDGDGCRIAVRCLIPGFVATKMTRIREGITAFVPGPETYVSHSLRSLSCNCECGRRRRNAADRISDGGLTGRLTDAVSAVFDSPSSPFSPGRTGTTTTGYLPHTIMLMVKNAAQWLVGDAYVSNLMMWYLTFARDCFLLNDAAESAAEGPDDDFPETKIIGLTKAVETSTMQNDFLSRLAIACLNKIILPLLPNHSLSHKKN